MNLPLTRANWPARWKELWAERAAIIEYQGNLSRPTAEFRAEQDIRKLATADPCQESTPVEIATPISVPCRECEAHAGEKCTSKPQPNGRWVRILPNAFHSSRWRDFNQQRAAHARLDEWNSTYRSTTP